LSDVKPVPDIKAMNAEEFDKYEQDLDKMREKKAEAAKR
jgi:hypothetical protein